MVERGGLENRCTLAGTEGSNPSPSAKYILISDSYVEILVDTHAYTHIHSWVNSVASVRRTFD